MNTKRNMRARASFKHALNNGFTMLELIVSVTIMVLLTGIALAGYPAMREASQFDTAVNEVIQAVRTAQLYSLSTKATSAPNPVYGVEIPADGNNITIFADNDNNGYYNPVAAGGPDSAVGDPVVLPSGYVFQNSNGNAFVYAKQNGTLGNTPSLDVTFQRPSPHARIWVSPFDDGGQYIEIPIQGPGGKVRTITVTVAGLINVQ